MARSTLDAAHADGPADRTTALSSAGHSRKLSLADQVYARLRSEILRCEILPGAELSEQELAARFEVSKTPVREALGNLRQDGLVLNFPRRGYQVTAITFGDMNELFDVRTMLESGAAALACQRITGAELDNLRDMATADYDRNEELSVHHFIETNRRFHLAIARTSGNVRLFALIERHMRELERFFYIGAQSRDVNRETSTDHLEIVEALSNCNEAKVRELIVRHNDVTREGLLLVLSNSRKFGSIAI